MVVGLIKVGKVAFLFVEVTRMLDMSLVLFLCDGVFV